MKGFVFEVNEWSSGLDRNSVMIAGVSMTVKKSFKYLLYPVTPVVSSVPIHMAYSWCVSGNYTVRRHVVSIFILHYNKWYRN
jgi:hypothetical protein